MMTRTQILNLAVSGVCAALAHEKSKAPNPISKSRIARLEGQYAQLLQLLAETP